jgi:transposase
VLCFIQNPLFASLLRLNGKSQIKGKGNYCAVLVDLDTSKLITILSDVYDGLRQRSQETIKKTLIIQDTGYQI